MKQSKKLLTSVALVAALAIPFASTSQAAEEETVKPTPIVNEQGNPDTTPTKLPDGIEWITDEEIENGVNNKDGEDFINDGTIIDEGVNDKEKDDNGVVTDKNEDDKTPTIEDLEKDENKEEDKNEDKEDNEDKTPADKDENGKPDEKPTPLPDGMEWITDEEIENGVDKKDGEDFIFDKDGYIIDGNKKDDNKDKDTDNKEDKKTNKDDHDLTWDDIIKKHGVDENGYVKNGEYEDWHDRDSDYILDGKNENDLTWDDIKDKAEKELEPPVIFDPAKKEDKDKEENDKDDKKPMDKPEEEDKDDKKPMDKPVPTTPETPVKPAPIIPRHTNPKTGIASVGSIAGLLTMASFAFVGSKRK